MSWLRVFLLLLISCGFCTSFLFADGPADNDPDTVRPVPKVGIEVPADVRAELELGLKKLGELLLPLRPSSEDFGRWLIQNPNPRRAQLQGWTDYADIAIFHRAVSVALNDQEFFEPKEFDAARRLLAVGIERAEQLKAGKRPWQEQKGPVVRGYISLIDHTPQPYGVVIPDSYDFGRKQPYRLDVWFHGRGETLSELNFITQRMSTAGPIAPLDALVLHPYGRYCNANKFAGEQDTLEAINAMLSGARSGVRGGYRIDPRRIAVRGFSMGGAACWQFAVHYPALWFAATPGAGFSETPEFLKFFQKETLNPPWWEEKLWRWYDCPGYVANLKHLPVVAYSGENDIQKQAADVMAAAYEAEGMKLRHLIGPKTGHSIHPDAAKEIESKLADWAASTKDFGIWPDHLEFVTYSLIYPSGGWVSVNGMKEQWEKAAVIADHQPNGDVHVKTQNVTALTLNLGYWIKVIDPTRLVMDGQPIKQANLPAEDPFAFILEEGRWTHEKKAKPDAIPALRKRPNVCGPIDHAFMSSFIFVKPSGKCAHPEVQQWVDAEMNRAITQWRRQFRGDARVKLDTEITEEDVKTANLALWGDRQSNAWIKQVADTLPIQWDDAQIAVGEQKYDAPHHAVIAIYPNPQNPNKYIVLNSGFTYREYDYLNNARQTPKLPDWAVVDLRTPPNSRWPGKIVAADFFDEQWQLKPAREDK